MLKGKSIIRSQQFDRIVLEEIFRVAHNMKTIARESGGSNALSGKRMFGLFYEPSTRTKLSFTTAMEMLGGGIHWTDHARQFSSAAKGETLEDTIKIVSHYHADIIILRHFEEGAAQRASLVTHVPIINAGDGPGQHPTQALLDLFTIKRRFDRIDEISFALVGDLKNGRTVRSLVYLLSKFNIGKLYFVAPSGSEMKDDIKQHLDEHNLEYIEESDLEKVLPEVDVVYQTRVQKERFFSDGVFDEKAFNQARGKYIIDKRTLSLMKQESIIMHPLPRIDEITVDVDSDLRAYYFKQAQNGLYVRMALLKMILLG